MWQLVNEKIIWKRRRRRPRRIYIEITAESSYGYNKGVRISYFAQTKNFQEKMFAKCFCWSAILWQFLWGECDRVVRNRKSFWWANPWWAVYEPICWGSLLLLFPSLCFDLKCSIEFCAVCMRVCACVSMSLCALNTWFEMVIQAVMDCASLTLLGYSAKFDGISVSLFAMLYSSHVVHAARTQPRVACRWLHTHTHSLAIIPLCSVCFCVFSVDCIHLDILFMVGWSVGWRV